MYETVRVVEEAPKTAVVEERGWVSLYRLISTVVRTIVTQVIVRLMSPDGTVEVSRYVLPTRYVEREAVRSVATVFVGVKRPQVQTQPSPVPPAPEGKGAGVSVR